MMNDSVGMTSEDVKYVINSILSALDLSKLDEEDKEDIMVKFEEDSDYGMEGGEDFDLSGDEELSMDDEFDFSTDDEPMEGEMSEDDMYRDSFDDRDSKVIGVYSNIKKQRDEMSEEEKDKSHVSKIMDAIFKESSVDKVLESYFVISEEETKTKKTKITENKNSVLSSVRKLAETFEQELASEFIIKENNNFKFVGKTNKKNLVFEHNGEQIKISPKGEVL
jgi:hypothetical protein